MEPVKFEKQAKKQLQKREITPSAESWEKLEQRLEAQQENKNFNFWWIGAVAAVAVVFFFLGTFFGDQSGIQQTPAVVVTPSQEVQDKSTEENVAAQKREIQMASKEVEPENVWLKKPRGTQRLQQKVTDKALAVNSENRERSIPSKEDEKNTFLEPQEMLAQTLGEEKTSTAVDDAEIEALLMLASAEIEADPVYAQSTVNAKDLLNEVEFELEESFRDKVFEVIKEGLVKAKTAVANRNF